MPLQIRRGTEAERLVLATAPVEGELIWITDDQKLYIGDGATLAKNLTPVTGYNDSDAVDATAAALLAGTHTNIAFTYAGGAINAEVEFADFDGVVKAAAFNGSVVADDSTELVNAVDGTFNLDGTIKGHIVPDADEAYDIGSASYKFKDLYLSGSSIKLGGAEITSSGNAIVLPEGSYILGGYNSSIVADDSSVIVNTATKAITGTFTGDLTGSVFGDDSTTLVDSVNSLLVGNLTGDVDNNTVTTRNINSSVVVLEGENDLGTLAGIIINTDGDFNDDYDLFTINASSATADGPGIFYNRSRGTPTARTASVTGDNIMTWFFIGYDTDDNPQLSASVTSKVSGTVGSGAVPGKLEFATANSSGNIVTALTIDENQKLTFSDVNEIQSGGNSGEVDLTTSTVAASFLKVNVGGVDYAIPLHAINP